MNKQMQTFSFNPPIKLSKEGKCLLAVTSFEATSSVFNKTDEKNSFSICKPCRWAIPNHIPNRIFDNLKDLLKLRSEEDFELHVKEVKKRRNRSLKGDKENKLSDFDAHQKDILKD